jgi:hypothetical protein
LHHRQRQGDRDEEEGVSEEINLCDVCGKDVVFPEGSTVSLCRHQVRLSIPEGEDDAKEMLGREIDRLDSIAHGLVLPMAAEFHIKMLREILPEIVANLKQQYGMVFGDNPWTI